MLKYPNEDVKECKMIAYIFPRMQLHERDGKNCARKCKDARANGDTRCSCLHAHADGAVKTDVALEDKKNLCTV